MRSKKNTDFFAKLKTHPYLHISLVYLGSAMAVMHFSEMVFPVMHLPHWSVSLVIILALIGLPIVLLMKWALQKNHPRLRSKKIVDSDKSSKDQPHLVLEDSHPGLEKSKLRRSWSKIVFAFALSILIFAGGVFGYARFVYKAEFSGKEKSLAVLPFLNIGGNKENEYLSDGITEDIIAQVGMIKELNVISRTSVMQYKNTYKNIKQIASELNVAAILEGSVQRSQNKIRITAQLIDAETDEHIWAHTYDKTLDEIFEIQRDVSTQIATALRANLSKETEKQISKPLTSNYDAYDLYSKGRSHWNKRTKADLLLAIEYFEKATKNDPAFTLAYAGIADSYTILFDNGFLPIDSVASKARYAVEKALMLDSNLAEVRASYAIYLSSIEGNSTAALKQLEKAITINSNYASAFQWYSVELSAKGQFQKAEEYIDKAIRIDPFSARIYYSKFLIYRNSRQFSRAIEHLEHVPDMIVRNNSNEEFIAELFYFQGNKDSAKYYSQLSGDKLWTLFTMPDIPAFKNEIRNLASSNSVLAEEIAYYYTLANEKDSAFTWLHKSIQRREYGSLKFLAVDPQWDPLRNDPRFGIILQNSGIH